MGNDIIDKQQLINAATDAQTIEDVVNGAADLNGTGILWSRLGRELKTLARLQQSLIQSPQLVWAGGPVSMQTATVDTAIPMDSNYSAPIAEYVSVSGSDITINKAGTYFLLGNTLQHSANNVYRFLNLKVNSGVVHQVNNFGINWASASASTIINLNVGDVVNFSASVDASSTSPFSAHGHGAPSRFYITYLGD